jgi:hypothetical protein
MDSHQLFQCISSLLRDHQRGLVGLFADLCVDRSDQDNPIDIDGLSPKKPGFSSFMKPFLCLQMAFAACWGFPQLIHRALFPTPPLPVAAE